MYRVVTKPLRIAGVNIDDLFTQIVPYHAHIICNDLAHKYTATSTPLLLSSRDQCVPAKNLGTVLEEIFFGPLTDQFTGRHAKRKVPLQIFGLVQLQLYASPVPDPMFQSTVISAFIVWR
jgi:hypothetical protein